MIKAETIFSFGHLLDAKTILQMENKRKEKEYYNYIVLLLLGIVFSCYYPALNNHFLFWDDQFYVTQNPLIIHPSWTHLFDLSNKIVSLNYHPLIMLSLWLNSKCFGLDSAKSFIIVNIILHLINSGLVYVFLRKMFVKAKIIAICTFIIFALHPMHIESVIWVSERKDVLFSCFYLAGLIFYLKHINEAKSRHIILTFLLFVFSCLSKAVAVSIVPVFFLIDFYFKRNFKSKSLYIEKTPFLVVAVFIGLIAINVQGGGDYFGLLNKTTNDIALVNNNFSINQKLDHLTHALFFYLKKFILPFGLSVFHPYDFNNISKMGVVSNISSIVFILVLMLSFFKSKKLFFGLGFFLLTIFLVLQFVSVGSAIAAERYTYLPYIGLSIPIGMTLQLLYSYNKYASIIILAAVTFALYFLTSKNLDAWKNHISLFE